MVNLECPHSMLIHPLIWMAAFIAFIEGWKSEMSVIVIRQKDQKYLQYMRDMII